MKSCGVLSLLVVAVRAEGELGKNVAMSGHSDCVYIMTSNGDGTASGPGYNCTKNPPDGMNHYNLEKSFTEWTDGIPYHARVRLDPTVSSPMEWTHNVTAEGGSECCIEFPTGPIKQWDCKEKHKMVVGGPRVCFSTNVTNTNNIKEPPYTEMPPQGAPYRYPVSRPCVDYCAQVMQLGLKNTWIKETENTLTIETLTKMEYAHLLPGERTHVDPKTVLRGGGQTIGGKPWMDPLDCTLIPQSRCKTEYEHLTETQFQEYDVDIWSLKRDHPAYNGYVHPGELYKAAVVPPEMCHPSCLTCFVEPNADPVVSVTEEYYCTSCPEGKTLDDIDQDGKGRCVDYYDYPENRDPAVKV